MTPTVIVIFLTEWRTNVTVALLHQKIQNANMADEQAAELKKKRTFRKFF